MKKNKKIMEKKEELFDVPLMQGLLDLQMGKSIDTTKSPTPKEKVKMINIEWGKQLKNALEFNNRAHR